MKFVDTNYFLRFLLRDNEKQHGEAKRLILEAASGKAKLVSSTIVFFEVAWVLRSVYGKDKLALADRLRKLLNINVDFSDNRLLSDALDLFEESNLSLEDCYNIIFARDCKVAEFKTFDKKLSKYYESQSR